MEICQGNTSLTPLTTTPKTHPQFWSYITTLRHTWNFRPQRWAFPSSAGSRKTSFQHQVPSMTSMSSTFWTQTRAFTESPYPCRYPRNPQPNYNPWHQADSGPSRLGEGVLAWGPLQPASSSHSLRCQGLLGGNPHILCHQLCSLSSALQASESSP